jgi:hypothetical protein
MANVKNFGLVGVGSDLQFGKAGTRLLSEAGVFGFKAANGTSDAAITLAGITSSAGNVTLTTGDVVLSSNSGKVTLGDAGSLSRFGTGVYKFSGTGAVVMPSGTSAQEPTPATYVGGFRYNTDTLNMEFSNGTVWTTIATGGTAVTAVAVNSANGFAGTSSGGTTPVLTIETSVSGFLVGNGTAVHAAVSGTDIRTVGGVSLLGTGDVGVIGAAYGGTGVDNTGKTITLGGSLTTAGAFNSTFTMTGTTAVTFPTSGTLATNENSVASFSTGTTGLLANGLTTAQTGAVTLSGTLAALNGGTGLASFSTGTVLYASGTNTWSAAAPGATSGVQAYDAGLTALAAKSDTGILVQTGADTYASRTLVAPTAGITISDPDGIAGNPTFALANDLAGLEGLSTTGYSVRTGDGTWVTRAITGVTGNTVITNGSGVASDTTIDLATVTQDTLTTGKNFVKVSLDGFGRVIGNTPVVTGDITTLVDGTYVNVTGDTMTGSLTMSSGATVTGLPDPVNSSDAANKNYVDNAVTGLTWKTAVLNATTANVTLSGEQTIDGVLTSASRILVKNQTDPTQNGIYVTAAGAWARATDANTGAELDSAAVFVQQGTLNGDTGWVQTTSTVVIGTSNIVWSQFSGSGAYTGGVGIDITGNVISAKLGAGITNLPSGEIGLDIVANEAIQLTTLLTGGQLTLVLDTGSGLAQSSSGLKINAASVTNAMLVNPSVGLNGDAGTSSLALGQTLQVIGTSAQGISTSVAGQTVTITAADAAYATKGVASFATTEFSVAAGAVSLGLVGVTKGGTGFSSYTVGDMLYANTTTSLAKLSDVAVGNVLLSGGVGAAPTYGKVDLTTAVSGILPAANGGTGVANTNTITLGGNVSTAGALTTAGALSTVGAFDSTFTMTGTTAVTFPTSGTLLSTATIAGSAVTSFQTSLSGLTPNTASNGVVTLAGTLGTASGGTGLTAFVANEVFYAGSTSTVAQSANFAFDGTSTLTLGGALPLAISGATGAITATATNSDIVLMPNGTGSVIIGPVGAGLIQSDPGTALTVRGNTTLALQSGTGSTSMVLTTGTTNKINVSGPTAVDYATGMADTNLVNKYYVDTAIANSAEKGAIKSFQATVPLNADGATNIGTPMPAGATVLSVKVRVDTLNAGTTLSVGKTGSVAAYMATTENDPQTAGLYMAECFVTEAGSVQLKADVLASGGVGSGSCVVIVTYQVAQ